MGKISPNIAKRIEQLAIETEISFSSNLNEGLDGYDSILFKAENYQDQVKLKEYLEQNLEENL